MKQAAAVNARVIDLLQSRGIVRGSVVMSVAGHDRLQPYLVIRVEGCMIWLADGRLRRLEKPKKKKAMHVRVLGMLADPGALETIESLGDAGQRNAALNRLLDHFLTANPLKEGI
jgi:hypothetical protein